MYSHRTHTYTQGKARSETLRFPLVNPGRRTALIARRPQKQRKNRKPGGVMAKKINVDKVWSAIKAQKQKSFTRLKKRYQKLMTQLNKLQMEIAKLKKSGVEFGSPSWKTQVT